MRRAIHYSFKIADRRASYDFFTKTLGMKVLSHAEQDEGCKVQCNGPYDNPWSKTMVGYGSEADHYVFELDYNYDVKSYKMGNDFAFAKIESSSILDRVKSSGVKTAEAHGGLVVHDPDGHAFVLTPGKSTGDPVVKEIALNVSDLKKSTDYWHKICEMKMISSDESHSVLAYDESQCALELRAANKPIERGTGYGRIAFSCPTAELPEWEKKMKDAKQKILFPLTTLNDDIKVVIPADPDDHEICFVGEEAYMKQAKVDPKADAQLQEAIQKEASGKREK